MSTSQSGPPNTTTPLLPVTETEESTKEKSHAIPNGIEQTKQDDSKIFKKPAMPIGKDTKPAQKTDSQAKRPEKKEKNKKASSIDVLCSIMEMMDDKDGGCNGIRAKKSPESPEPVLCLDPELFVAYTLWGTRWRPTLPVEMKNVELDRDLIKKYYEEFCENGSKRRFICPELESTEMRIKNQKYLVPPPRIQPPAPQERWGPPVLQTTTVPAVSLVNPYPVLLSNSIPPPPPKLSKEPKELETSVSKQDEQQTVSPGKTTSPTSTGCTRSDSELVERKRRSTAQDEPEPKKLKEAATARREESDKRSPPKEDQERNQRDEYRPRHSSDRRESRSSPSEFRRSSTDDRGRNYRDDRDRRSSSCRQQANRQDSYENSPRHPGSSHSRRSSHSGLNYSKSPIRSPRT